MGVNQRARTGGLGFPILPIRVYTSCKPGPRAPNLNLAPRKGPAAIMKNNMGWSEDLGSKLKGLRLSRKVKQIDLARSLGISPAYLNLIENNKRPMNVDVLEKLLNFFQIDMEVFMSSSEGVKLQNRLEQILRDPFFQAHSIGNEEMELLGKRSSLSNLILSLYDGFKNAQQELNALQTRLFKDERTRETETPGQDKLYILDRTAYDEVTEFLEAHHNFFPELEGLAEDLLRREGVEDGRRTTVLCRILRKQFGIDVIRRPFPPESGLLRLYNEKTHTLYVSNRFERHRLHFQLAHFIGLLLFDREPAVDEMIAAFNFQRPHASRLAKVNLANYFAGALLMPYAQMTKWTFETGYDIRTMEGLFGTPFEPIAHRLCTLNKPGHSGIPLHFIKTDIAGIIRKKYAGTGIRIDDRRGSCPKWAVHMAFLTPSILRSQYSTMPDGESYFCTALAMIQTEPNSGAVINAISVGIGCRAEDAHRMVYSRGLRFENPELDGVRVGITCRLCDRGDCTQRALPSFKTEYEVNTINRKENILSPVGAEDLLMIARDHEENGNHVEFSPIPVEEI